MENLIYSMEIRGFHLDLESTFDKEGFTVYKCRFRSEDKVGYAEDSNLYGVVVLAVLDALKSA